MLAEENEDETENHDSSQSNYVQNEPRRSSRVGKKLQMMYDPSMYKSKRKAQKSISCT